MPSSCRLWRGPASSARPPRMPAAAAPPRPPSGTAGRAATTLAGRLLPSRLGLQPPAPPPPPPAPPPPWPSWLSGPSSGASSFCLSSSAARSAFSILRSRCTVSLCSARARRSRRRISFCSSRRSSLICAFSARFFDHRKSSTSRLLPLSRRTSITPTSTTSTVPGGALRAATKGIIIRCTSLTPKTNVASSHIAMEAIASSQARQTSGPPSPIMLSMGIAPLV
mmetsp:Transcript_18924/g.60294  ORF Transcript_18924/g.60294 Transcript_18924/m.60294 type:complete len:224 (-) Transcript_18924:823-1494(-)